MKKLVITLSIVLIGLLGYSQVTSVGEFRVATAATEFGVNLPVGTKVYNIETGDYWVATAGVISTATLSDASTSFTKLNDAGTDDQTAEEVVVTATGNLASENVQSALLELQGDIDGISDTDDQTAAEVDITDADGDYTSTNVEGALSEIGDSFAAHRTDITQNAADIATFETNVSTALSTGTVDGISYGITSDGGADDVILAAATSSTAGVMAAAQYTKLDGIEAGAQVNLTMITEKFEEDDGTASAHSLSQTAVTAQGAIVTINGVTLAPANYTLATTSITMGVPVYQYDQIVITYFY
ncbi:hypothetical protein [Mariniphaga sp.]|uniref:hypothetical protein n=1 Tax=Mariniphaga sp. TaxID=1954475 RepID=UPI0035655137